MPLIFPTVAGFVVIAVLAAGPTGHAGWLVAASVLLAGFAIYTRSRESPGSGRIRVQIGAALGIGCLVVALITRDRILFRWSTEWFVIGVLISLFVIRGRRFPGPRSTEPAGGTA